MFRKLKYLFIFVLVLSSVSCRKTLGYAFVLWSDNETLHQTGSILEVVEESKIRDTWVYINSDGEETEIDKWRTAFYEKKEEAEKRKENYMPYINYTAVSNRQGHSMRSEPKAATQNIVYKLLKNQRVKVIGRTDEKVTISRFTGYWYHLLTEDGTEGWSYDSYLKIYDGDKLIWGKEEEENPELDKFTDNIWRPEYFKEMIQSRKVNLTQFKTKYGIFINKDKKEISLQLPDQSVTEIWNKIEKTGKYSYKFEGTSFHIDMKRKDSVIIDYNYDNKDYTKVFELLEEDVKEVINNEYVKKQMSFNEFMMNGPKYTSKGYGSITFDNGNKFTWTNRENLISQQLITPNAGESGSVSFNLFLDDSIANKYDGALTFDFGDRQELSFLYTFAKKGLQLVVVPENKIKKSEIQTDNYFTPVKMFFLQDNETNEEPAETEDSQQDSE